MNIVAIIQARMSSVRLPGKVLLPLSDTTVLGYTVRRVKEAKQISEVIVATSDESEDDPIEEEALLRGARVFRGSLDDVLDRYYNATRTFGVEHICRVTADCPLIDPEVINRVASEYVGGRFDYVSTGRISSTFPDGMDTEIFSSSVLDRAWKDAMLPSEREHVTSYIWKHPEMFKIGEVRNEVNLSKIRLTVDEMADYEVVKKIVADVHPISLGAIVDYLASNPEVAALNGSIGRDEGYIKSLAQDQS